MRSEEKSTLIRKACRDATEYIGKGQSIGGAPGGGQERSDCRPPACVALRSPGGATEGARSAAGAPPGWLAAFTKSRRGAKGSRRRERYCACGANPQLKIIKHE